jgi:starch phosphorylase
MDIVAELRSLARNLYWTWQPDFIDIFRDLDPVLWRDVNHNPFEFLSRLEPEALQERASNMALDARINYAFHQLRDYIEQTDTWGSLYAPVLQARPVAYFSAEFGLHESLPLYSGGLGVLAGDHLKSMSDLGIPAVGVGLYYARGYFNQELDESGWQREQYLESDVHELPLELATDANRRPIRVRVRTRDSEIIVAVWSARVGRNRLILLDSDLEENRAEDRELTARLYGGDQWVRIRQELILGVGGLRALRALDIQPSVLHLNEGHSAFAVLERARQMMRLEDRPFEHVRDRVAGQTVFTTHTPVEAGHDRFKPELVEETIGPLRDQIGLDQGDVLALGREDPEDPGQPFCMTVLGMKMAEHINAVSSLHGRVTRRMWSGLWSNRTPQGVPIGHITNAVHIPSWLAVPMVRFYRRLLGQDWQRKMCDPGTWAPIMHMDEEEFWEQQQIVKVQLVNFLHRRVCRECGRSENAKVALDHEDMRFDPGVLTIGFARRFTAYKRPEILLKDLERLDRMVNDPDNPVQIVYSGKAHPADEEGKHLIQKVIQVSRDQRFRGRICFVEDYDINVARHLVQGVDLWLNTPRRPLEACGTSGQKVILNGGLNLSVLDGWWPEAYDGQNGFAIGDERQHLDPQEQDRFDTEVLFNVLEKKVIPLFYRRDERDIPRGWIARQKNAIRGLAWRFNADRMVTDYTLNCYLPAAGATTSDDRGCSREATVPRR